MVSPKKGFHKSMNYSGPERRTNGITVEAISELLDVKLLPVTQRLDGMEGEIKDVKNILNGNEGLVAKVAVLHSKDEIVTKSDNKWFSVIGVIVVVGSLLLALYQQAQAQGLL